MTVRLGIGHRDPEIKAGNQRGRDWWGENTGQMAWRSVSKFCMCGKECWLFRAELYYGYFGWK